MRLLFAHGAHFSGVSGKHKNDGDCLKETSSAPKKAGIGFSKLSA
jgi:hypothetical protein